jgi:hypothetical protein
MKARITQLENDFANLWYYPEQGIIHHQFLQPVSDETFRSVLMAGLRLMQTHGAKKWLSDDRLNSILPAETSAWSQEFWLPRAYEAGWQYWAMLQPARARGRINTERLITYVNEKYDIEIKLFEDPDRAWHWLAQQVPTAE